MHQPPNVPDPENTRNIMMAVVAAGVFMVIWQIFVLGPEQEAIQAAQKVQQDKATIAKLAEQGDSLAPNAVEPVAPGSQTHTASVSPTQPEGPRIAINTPRLHGSLSLTGARLDALTLANYRQELDSESPEVQLLSRPGSEYPYFAEFGWVGTSQNSSALPNRNTRWSVVSPGGANASLTPEQPLILRWNNRRGLVFTRTISIDENYMFTVEQRVENVGARNQQLSSYALINRQYPRVDQEFFILHEGPLAVQNEILEEFSYSDLRDDEAIRFNDVKGWIGVSDKYWLTALIPPKGTAKAFNFNHYQSGDKDRYQVDFLGEANVLQPGAELSVTTHFFAGAKELDLIDRYSERLTIPLFDRSIDFGWLYFLTKPFFHIMTFFNSLVGNFGLAIMCLTICVKMVLFPLANKSYVAMGQMKLLMPQIQELRERYGDDKLAMNQEMMKLYQKEKVNPMSGCLPILVQIPVFFALYKVLFVSIEMRHAPFFGWIHDLSAPDPTSVINLFGLIPFDPPSFLAIGIWPVIMCATMVIQQKLNPKPTDEMQAKVMAALPYIFLFLFASFPAGLVIYWAWNNTLSIIQQWVIMKRHGRN